MMYSAHSPDSGRKIRAQSYYDHTASVAAGARKRAIKAARFYKGDTAAFIETIETAAWIHDLGKLPEENQIILRGEKEAPRLPIIHTDAGVKQLKRQKKHASAILVYAHHIGYPNIPAEANRKENALRIESTEVITYQDTEDNLDKYVEIHQKLVHPPELEKQLTKMSGLEARIALSCLVDADHSDTAKNYKNIADIEAPETRWEERLKKLDIWAAAQFKKDPSERNKLRMDIYNHNRNSPTNNRLSLNSDNVGTGKTTSITAALINCAIKNDLRHIYIIEPQTSIITQTVNKLREIVTLEGENPDQVVAEIHHKVDFESLESRHLSYLWEAPIIVTTSVSFFETLSANRPGALRKLHQLPGSAIFWDEYDASLQYKQFPICWKWINDLAENWGCFWVLGSGTAARLWELQEFKIEK